MKSRHMEGLDHPLTLDEILDETNQLDVTSKTKQWLLTEALGKIPDAYPDPAVHYEEFGVIDLLPVPTTGFCSHFIIYFVFKF